MTKLKESPRNFGYLALLRGQFACAGKILVGGAGSSSKSSEDNFYKGYQCPLQMVAEDLHTGFYVTPVGSGQSSRVQGLTKRGRKDAGAEKMILGLLRISRFGGKRARM